MPPKKKPDAQPELLGDIGSQFALKRWEQQERDDAKRVADLQKELDNLLLLDREDDEIKTQISVKRGDLASAKDGWAQSAKILLQFDKSVAPEKREGEKVTMIEHKEMFLTTLRMSSGSVESALISVSQDQIGCKTEPEFYKMMTENVRQSHRNIFEAAIREKKLPEWCKEVLDEVL